MHSDLVLDLSLGKIVIVQWSESPNVGRQFAPLEKECKFVRIWSSVLLPRVGNLMSCLSLSYHTIYRRGVKMIEIACQYYTSIIIKADRPGFLGRRKG